MRFLCCSQPTNHFISCHTSYHLKFPKKFCITCICRCIIVIFNIVVFIKIKIRNKNMPGLYSTQSLAMVRVVLLIHLSHLFPQRPNYYACLRMPAMHKSLTHAPHSFQRSGITTQECPKLSMERDFLDLKIGLPQSPKTVRFII